MKRPLFTPRATTVFRATLLGGVALLVGGGFAYYRYYRSPFWSMTGVAVDQPVLFSHRHHAEELRIDCRYCHTTVETSSFAGVPSTHTCLTCHSQIFTHTPMLRPVVLSASRNEPPQWNRVTTVPDHVYFNHSIHIAKGVACVTCHGDVGDMALTAQGRALEMRWCVDCHREPGPQLARREDVFAPRAADRRTAGALSPAEIEERAIQRTHLTNCATCHR